MGTIWVMSSSDVPLVPRARPETMGDCPVCGRELPRKGTWEQQVVRKYCSQDCRSIDSVERAKQADPAMRRCVEENIAIHYDSMRSFAWKLVASRAGMDHEDLMSRTVEAMLRWPTFREDGSAKFTTWAWFVMDKQFKSMLTEARDDAALKSAWTARHGARSMKRRNGKPITRTPDIDYGPFHWSETVEDDVMRPLLRLPLLHREIAFRHWIEGDSLVRIAHDTRLTVEQVVSRLAWATKIARRDVVTWKSATCRRTRGPKKPPAVRICIFPACGRRRTAKDYCSGHKMQQRLGKPLAPIMSFVEAGKRARAAQLARLA